MKRSVSTYIFFVLIFSQCGLINNKKQKEEMLSTQEIVKRPEQILAEEKIRQDSIENAALEQAQKTAFGELQFGMEKEKVEFNNEKRQLLGKYNYNFTYSFNEENQLFKVKIISDAVKALQYDTNLKYSYQNLLNIIKTKYGDPATSVKYSSIFDIQNSKKLRMNHWEKGTRQIDLGLQENKMNSYSVFCDIYDKNMDEAETQRLKNLKNKDVIKASEKF